MWKRTKEDFPFKWGHKKKKKTGLSHGYCEDTITILKVMAALCSQLKIFAAGENPLMAFLQCESDIYCQYSRHSLASLSGCSQVHFRINKTFFFYSFMEREKTLERLKIYMKQFEVYSHLFVQNAHCVETSHRKHLPYFMTISIQTVFSYWNKLKP